MLTYVQPDVLTRPFKRGDLVDTMDREGQVMESAVKVVKATKKFVTIEDGRQWCINTGYWRGENQVWPFPWIRHHKDTP